MSLRLGADLVVDGEVVVLGHQLQGVGGRLELLHVNYAEFPPIEMFERFYRDAQQLQDN